MAARMKAYASPDEWLADAADWQTPLISRMRAEIHSGASFEETIKWGNLFFRHQGLCILIRHEPERIILGFMRGKRLRDIEPRLKASGKYELANIQIREESGELPTDLARLAATAAELNDRFGDPTARSD